MGRLISLVILVTSLESFCVGVPAPQNDCHYLLLLPFQSPGRLANHSPSTLCSWEAIQPHIALTEQKQLIKSSPPDHRNRARVSPWAHPPFLPLHHWGEGPCCCQQQRLHARSPSQPSHHSSLG